ncbi:hypothetical protein BOTBODRAFT_162259 [Botryobasidium botryosum FD-172 SS1]|uniref:FAD/NAD(P)-binding domain-containing protein n=1 Tax=Botryobasidium botryosum (strain FD-172 SS1) TaxID=930990 RepID=A0A067MJK3_BOTB1|nr:hypothetical protein BOTBODRAFT_162259 [Botryobasidium botryosum FD-172 SS1]
MLRTSVTSEGALEERTLVPFDKVFSPGKPGTVKIATVTEVTDGVVKLGNGETVPYDYLVVASGTQWEGFLDYPLDKSEAISYINGWREKFANAKEVVIVGGGAVGVELAGEIADFYPSTTVHIVHSGPQLLNDAYGAKLRRSLAAQLKAKGVQLHLDDRVEIPDTPGVVTTKKGVQLKADLFIPARGGRPRTAFLQTLDPSIIAENGRVKVLPTLQVPLANGKTNVFAIGDVIDWDEQKMQMKADAHGGVVLPNLLSLLNNSKPSKQYKTGGEAIIVTVGRDGGAGFLPMLWGITLGAWAAAMLKSKSLFIDMTRKGFGY